MENKMLEKQLGKIRSGFYTDWEGRMEKGIRERERLGRNHRVLKREREEREYVLVCHLLGKASHKNLQRGTEFGGGSCRLGKDINGLLPSRPLLHRMWWWVGSSSGFLGDKRTKHPNLLSHHPCIGVFYRFSEKHDRFEDSAARHISFPHKTFHLSSFNSLSVDCGSLPTFHLSWSAKLAPIHSSSFSVGQKPTLEFGACKTYRVEKVRIVGPK